MINELLEYKKESVDVNTKNKSGKTAAHMAVQAGRFEILKLLLQYPSFDPNVKDDTGKTILHLGLFFFSIVLLIFYVKLPLFTLIFVKLLPLIVKKNNYFQEKFHFKKKKR